MKKMKAIRRALMLCALPLLATACIQDEAPNAEADIETCLLAGDVLNREPVVENNRVTLIVKKGTDVTALAPEFTLTPGATISPASGTVLDFTRPQSYVVTSEDGNWSKTYTVEVSFSGITISKYRFEQTRLDEKGKYYIFYDTDLAGKQQDWASGNPGFALTGAGNSPADYPTYHWAEGKTGYCLGLTTRRTGSWGNLMNMPLAAGNLFIGTFDTANALTNPLTATRFGKPFYYIPTYVRGYYRYTAGDTFYELDKSLKDKLRPVPGVRDVFDIYAVFYESTPDMPTLDGINRLAEDNPNILAVARIDDPQEATEWTEFVLPFVFRAGKEVDPVKLAEGKYNLAIVFSSSVRGDYFEGAPGSTLLIDEVELGYVESEE